MNHSFIFRSISDFLFLSSIKSPGFKVFETILYGPVMILSSLLKPEIISILVSS